MSIDRFTRLYHLYTKKKDILIRSSFRVCILVFLIGISSTSNKLQAQTNANCYGPFNPTPASTWGIAEKFQSNPLIWNGGTPTAADLNGDGISELLVPAADQSGYYVYKGNGSNKSSATKDYVISNTGRFKSSQPAIANIITATSTPEVVMINKTGFVYIFDNVGGSETNYLFKSTTATQYLTSGTPYIVDIDQDGIAEIVVGSDVFGIVGGALVKRVAGPALNYVDGTASSGSTLDLVVVDIIASNPGKELVYGSRVYSINLTAGTMSILKDMRTITGFTTIAAGDNGPTAVAYDLEGNKLSYPVSSNDYSKLNDTYTKNMSLINLPLPKKLLEDRLAKEKAIQLAEEVAMSKTFKLTIDSLKAITKDYIELHHPFDQVYVVKEDLNSYYKIIERVKRMKGKKIIIVSAADCNGSSEYNENLSERRAKRIYATLSKLSTNNVIIRNVGERELIEACDKASNNKALQKVNRYSYVFILDK